MRQKYSNKKQIFISLTLVVVLSLCLSSQKPQVRLFSWTGNSAIVTPVFGTKISLNTDSLKSSGWFDQAIRQLNQSTYHIKKDKTGKSWYAANRAQNLFFNYRSDGFEVTPKDFIATETGKPASQMAAIAEWSIRLQVAGLSKGDNVQKKGRLLAAGSNSNTAFMDYGDLRIAYTNSEKGMRQDFIVKQKPTGSKKLRTHLRFNTSLHIQTSANGLAFLHSTTGTVMQYNNLKVWDANGMPLAASFVQEDNNGVAIEVNDSGAAYPITIDPLSSSASTILDDGDQVSAFFGYAVSSAGDVNGDGFSDVVVGAYLYDELPNDQRGRAFVYHGSATGLTTTPASVLDDVGQNQAWFGYAVATCGDVNGDGFSDVMVSAPQFDDGANSNEGRVFVYHGSATGLGSLPNYVLDDGSDESLLGYSIATAGDINNDGYSDVSVGVFGNEQVLIYMGSAGGLSANPATTINTPVAGGFSAEVAAAGDVNGDGYSDIIVGAPSTDIGANSFAGVAYLFHGSAAGIATSPNAVIDHLNIDGAEFGTSVSAAGDVNGDGYSDVVVGAPYVTDGVNNSEGLAFIYHGSAAGIGTAPVAILDDADAAGANFGHEVASAGDINGDGYADVIIGAYSFDDGANANEGRSFVYYGSATGISASPISNQDGGSQADMLFGISLASAGDVNGDGYSDIVIGASQYNGSQIREGRAFVYHGSADGLSTVVGAVFSHNNQADAQRGYFVNSAGDVNADGYSDVLVSARLYDDGFTDEGVVYVYHGSASGIATTPNYTLDDANQAGARFGSSASFAGDINGDGYGDVIVGADRYDNGNTDEGAAFIYYGSATGLAALPAVILDGANQNTASFGFSVAAAGDVNADGFSDVVVGAYQYDDVSSTNEGRAYIYHGSASGIANTPTTVLDNNQSGGNMGVAVNGAGDVNGDGYGDVLVGAWLQDDDFNNEGVVFVYHGGALGISSSPAYILNDCDQLSGFFGTYVSTAGDLNGDGFSDVIIGAYNASGPVYTSDGTAYIYHGSPTGLAASPAIMLADGGSNGALYGVGVGSAGDVNGDGYSDVVVGSSYFDGDFTDEGGAFIYYGSPSGVSATPDISLQPANQTVASFGFKATSAGDVNGDGYSDVVIGASLYDNGATNTGNAYLYYGNVSRGYRNNLRLYNSDLVTPIQQSNLSDPNLFGLGLFQKSPLGRQSAKLVWERVGNGVPFSGNPIANSVAFTGKQFPFTDLGTSGIEMKAQVAKAVTVKYTAVRARTEYSKAKAITGQVFGPWRYPDYFLRGRRDLGAVALPVKFVAFTAVKQDGGAKLQWRTNSEQPGVSFEVQHSTDGLRFVTLASVPGKLLSSNDYAFAHQGPLAGKHHYRIKAVYNQETAYTELRRLNFKASVTFAMYPNPGKDILTVSLPTAAPAWLRIADDAGKIVVRQRLVNTVTVINIAQLPIGTYWVNTEQGGQIRTQQLVKQ